jgi:hypothetical protein
MIAYLYNENENGGFFYENINEPRPTVGNSRCSTAAALLAGYHTIAAPLHRTAI